MTAGQIGAEGMSAKASAYRNVTFTYPGSKDPVLDGLWASPTSEAGTSISNVGVNGAGKTTFGWESMQPS